MNLNTFTEKAQEAMVATPRLAASLSHVQAEPEHLLVTLAEQADGVVPALLQKLGQAPAHGRAGHARTARSASRQSHGGAEPGISPRLTRVLEQAQADATACRTSSSAPSTCSWPSSAEGGRAPAAELLRGLGVTPEAVREALADGARRRSASPTRTPRASTRRSSATAAT